MSNLPIEDTFCFCIVNSDLEIENENVLKKTRTQKQVIIIELAENDVLAVLRS